MKKNSIRSVRVYHCFHIVLLVLLLIGVVPLRGIAQSDTVEDAIGRADRYRDAAASYYFILNNAETASREADKAKRTYQHIIDNLEPHNAYAWVNLGVIALMQARHPYHKKDREVLLSVAHSKLMQADEKRKGYGIAHIYMAELYALQEDWSSAVAKLSELQRSDIDNSYIRALWAYVLMKQGLKDAAKPHLRKAVELGDPQNAATWAREHIR